MNLHTWYGTAVAIPNYGDHRFPRFVASCVGLVNAVVRRHLDKQVRVSFMQGGTAAADQDNGVIHLNEEYLRGVFPRREEALPADQAISVILGIVVHEAAHFAWSPRTLVPWSEYIEARTPHRKMTNVARILGNLTEDIYIEAEVHRRIPNLSWMLDATNSVFFTAQDALNSLESAAHIKDAPTKHEDLRHAMNAMFLVKTQASIESTPYIEDLFYMAAQAADLEKFDHRLQLTLEIYNELVRNLEEGEESGKGGSAGAKPGDGQGDSSTEEGLPQDGGKGEEGKGKAPSLKELSEKVAGLTANQDLGTIYIKRAGEDVAHKTNNQITRVANFNMLPLPGEEGDASGCEAPIFEIEMERSGSYVVPMDKRYERLAELGRQRATSNRPYGQQRTRGNNIRNLHRIATDGKIFAEPTVMNDYKPMQVIILVDCSGSMESALQRFQPRSRIEAAMEAALGAAYGLTAARCEVAVYGHTADTLDNRETIIYKIKEFNQPIEWLPATLGDCYLNHDKGNNRDGHAIWHVAQKFTNRQRKRLLIVISDGAPAATGYGGKRGDEHAHEKVEEVRRGGIDVLSISITPDAKQANDFIYGSEKNVFNEDPNVIERVVQSLLS